VLQALSRRLHVPAMGLALIAAAVVFAVSVGVMSRADPAGACTDQNHSTVEVVGGTGPGGQFTKSQVHALQCMGMPAVIPTKGVPGLGAADPNVAVSAHGMMYNVTWKGPDGHTASLMIDHSLGSKLDMATSNRDINLGHGVTGYLTDYGAGGNDGEALELAWRDPRTSMWYKINGLPVKQAIAFYHSLRPVDLAHAG
jgi:hypothetical protein